MTDCGIGGGEARLRMPGPAELERDLLIATGSARVRVVDASAAGEGAPVPCVIAIGAFDGCHRGHQELLAHAVRDARARGVEAVAVTFNPDPDEVLSPNPARKLMTAQDRFAALAALGAQVAVVPFTPELAALDHQAFFDEVLAPALDIRAIHVGSDFRLGARGASTVEVIREWGATRGIEVTGHDLLTDGARPITATRIRASLAAGAIEHAARELGRRPLVRGRVGHGRGEGTGMGFPTANIAVPTGLQLPADGVYAGFVAVGCDVWPAAINAGVPPMFSDSPASAHLEANLIGYEGDLYGAQVDVLFDRRLRPSCSFDSLDALIRAVQNDIDAVRTNYGEEPVRIARDF
ncbi:MAG: bifunctional riboflavin kinase/FMN adenylyltransferase [Coriobacteriaceae bacterium]|nr:bifunctional riboflavin kinase/FMN adenylyltransferase [Coriobacteriaceae bacterium]